MKKEYINLLREKKVKQIQKIGKKDLYRCSCDHRKANHKTALVSKDDDPNETVCKICQYEIDLEPADMKELKEACALVNNSIQQIKAVYHGDEKIFNQLGKIIFYLEKLPSWYKNIYLAKKAEADEEADVGYTGSNGTVYINSNNSSFGLDFNDKKGKKKGKKKHHKKNKNKW